MLCRGGRSARRLQPQGLELVLRLPLDPEKTCKEADTFLRGTLNGDPKWQSQIEMAS